MNKIKIVEFFGGISAPYKALINVCDDVESLDYVEIDKNATIASSALYSKQYEPQDIKKWKNKMNSNPNLLVHGSPCTDFSNNGKNDITKGRSILYQNTLKLIEEEFTERPKVVIWENVRGLVSKRNGNIEHFEYYLSEMERLGYKNYHKILNSKNYGIPQNRERIFTVSVLGDTEFEFPEEIPIEKNLMYFIDKNVNPEEYALTDLEKTLFFEEDGELYVRENNKRGRMVVNDGDAVNLEHVNSKTRRGRVQKQIIPTLTTSPQIAVYYDGILRKLTAKECWLLMGFTEEDYLKAESTGLPKADLYKLAGNSIVVDVLEKIYQQLIKLNIL